MTCTGWKSSTCCYRDNRALFPFQRPFLVPSHWQCSCFRGFLAFLLTAKAARWDKMTGIRGGNRNRIEMSWVFESDNNDWTWKHNNKHRNAIMGKCAETQHFVVLLKVFSGWHIISASLIIYSGTFSWQLCLELNCLTVIMVHVFFFFFFLSHLCWQSYIFNPDPQI